MTASTRAPLVALLGLVALPAALVLADGPPEGLLPPPVRQAEKRALGGNNVQVKRTFYDGRGGIGAAFSPDGKYLVASAGYQGMAMWEVATGRSLGQFTNTQNNQGGVAVAFTPDGKQVIATLWGNYQQAYPVGVWDVTKRERLRTVDDDVNDTPFTALAISPDGKTLALATGQGQRNEPLSLAFWDLASGDEITRIRGLVNLPLPPGPRGPNTVTFEALAYSPDGRTLAVLLEGRILLVELATSKVRNEINFVTAVHGQPTGQSVLLGSLAFSPDGQVLAAGCSDGAIRLFDMRSGRELTPLPGHREGVVALWWARDGRRLQSYGLDGQFFAWRTERTKEWQPRTGQLSEVALESLWDVLRDDDPRDLFGCVRTLAINPEQTVPFLRKRLSAVPRADTNRIENLVAELRKGDYNSRRRAVIGLRKIGAAAAPALQKLQQQGFYDPLAQRLSFELANLAPPPERVRALRAIRVLEGIGDAAARKLLQELSEGAPEAALTTEAKAALNRLSKVETVKADPAPETLWQTLAGDDCAAAYRAIRALAHQPTTAAMLRDRLKEVVSKETFNNDPKRVAKLIADLDSKSFAVRERASKALHNLGRVVVPALRKALTAEIGLETKRRLEKLLTEASKTTPPPEMLRVERALETLELMGGAEARQALVALAEEVQAPWLREAAGAALRRQRDGQR